MTIVAIRTNSKRMKRNKIIEMSVNNCSFSNIVINIFVLLFPQKKKRKKNGKESLFLMNDVIL